MERSTVEPNIGFPSVKQNHSLPYITIGEEQHLQKTGPCCDVACGLFWFVLDCLCLTSEQFLVSSSCFEFVHVSLAGAAVNFVRVRGAIVFDAFLPRNSCSLLFHRVNVSADFALEVYGLEICIWLR